jgi:hypothetical protein
MKRENFSWEEFIKQMKQLAHTKEPNTSKILKHLKKENTAKINICYRLNKHYKKLQTDTIRNQRTWKP